MKKYTLIVALIIVCPLHAARDQNRPLHVDGYRFAELSRNRVPLSTEENNAFQIAAEAAQTGDLSLVTDLLHRYPGLIQAFDFHGKTLLRRAALASRLNIVKFLFYNGAAVFEPHSSIQDTRHLAVTKDDVGLLKTFYLQKRDGSFIQIDEDNVSQIGSLLRLAVFYNAHKCLQYLLGYIDTEILYATQRRPSFLTAPDADGVTLRDFASTRKNQKIKNLVEAAVLKEHERVARAQQALEAGYQQALRWQQQQNQ